MAGRLQQWPILKTGQVHLNAFSERRCQGPFLGPKRAGIMSEAYANGDLKVMGEIGAQYHGLDPSDEWFEPYLALAEEFDIPVGIHTGLAPPGTPYGCCPDFSVSLGNPLRLEPMLKRHPKLRVWMAHAGWPYLEETKAILYMYPQVHADLSVINWI